MQQLILSVSIEADKDLQDIWLYAARRNQIKARQLVKTILDKFEQLMKSPNMGRLRNELIPNLRSVVQGGYTIFYHITDEKVTIVRVLHNRRDFKQYLN